MGWLRDNALVVWLGVLIVSGILLAVVFSYVGLVVYAALGSAGSVAGVLLNLAVPYLPIVTALLIAIVIAGFGLGWQVLHRLSIPQSERLQSVAEHVERKYPVFNSFGLSELVSPPEPSADKRAEDALDKLKQQYIAGKIDEATFERELDRLVANESVDDVRAARERETILDERADERSS